VMKLWAPQGLRAASFGNVRFFVEPICAPGSISVVFGAREAGKTQLFFSIIRAMHEGSHLLGRFKCQSARVALVEVDMSEMTTQERLEKAAGEYTFSDELLCVAVGAPFNILL